ncbi:hypothetical protein C5F52_17415 [Limnohabitans sp. TS-CS-82]|uniref:YjbH domain-containing protein n=1 Tax=Limnohabitans sp. TS-CS-82 TaxID=2094193 RepID=UPI000CF2D234|nr:YjbH domain-containing protein [Limnohabitans sp. TS-CS-82]PQA81803.1 hypothetical protein C5F52_17415 [Limnohabitans sp. TS-CS-82]
MMPKIVMLKNFKKRRGVVAVALALNAAAAYAQLAQPQVLEAQPQGQPQTQRLSAWLKTQTLPADAYPLGTLWATPEEKVRQQAEHEALLQSLPSLVEQGVLTASAMQGLQRDLQAMPPTGRVKLSNVEDDWLAAYPRKDPLLQPGDGVAIPSRPLHLRVMTQDGAVCEIPHREGLQAKDYVRACLGGDGPATRHGDWAWQVQPDGRVQHVPLALWNAAEQDQPAPGAWLWVPVSGTRLSLDWQQRWAEWLATQGVSTRLDLAAFAAPTRQVQPPALLPSVLDLEGRHVQPAPSASNWGNVGLLQTPTARMQEAGYFGLTFHRTWPYQNSNVFFQPTDWMEAGFRYTDTSNRLYGPESFSGTLPYKDKSIDLKLRAWRESALLPELAVGLRDVGGTGLYSSEYVVASKRTGRFDWSLGMGWGYLGARGNLSNPLSKVLGQRMDTRVQDGGAQGGKFSTSSWFRGNPALFGGVTYQTPWNVDVKVELDGNNYQHEPHDNNLPQHSPINWAVVYRPTKGLDVSMGLERGNTWSMGFTFYVDMAGLNVPKVTDPARPAVQVVRPKAEPNWAATADTLAAHTLWDVKQIYRDQNTVVVEAHNSASVYAQERLDRAVAVLHQAAPAEVENFEMHHHKVGDVLAVEKVNRTAWVAQQTQPARTQAPVQPVEPVYVTEASKTRTPLLPEKALNYWAEPGLDLIQTLGGPDGYLYQLSGALSMGLELPWNVKANGTLRYRLSDNYERFTPGWSNMPQVRTHIAEYMTTSRVTLENLSISKTNRVGQNWYGAAYAGYFENMFGGVGGEVLYRQPGSRWAAGLDVNHVKQRNFAQDFGFRDYAINTGHLTGYWITPFEGVHTSLSVGQYLAGDRGATMSVQKVFANGSSISAYATKTNVPAAVFGEGSFDKGIAWMIPFDAFLTSSSRYSAGWSWKPLLRDGGAKVGRPVNLFADTVWLSPNVKAHSPAKPDNDSVAPDDRVEGYQRRR